MKWKIFLIVFVVAFAGIILGNLVTSKQIKLSDNPIIQKLPFVPKKINVISKNPKFNIKQVKPEIMNTTLDSLQFWDKNLVVPVNSRGNITSTIVKPNQIVFELTDKEQGWDIFGQEVNGKLQISSSVGYNIQDNNSLHVLIFMNKENLQSTNASQTFNVLSFRAIYKLVNPNATVEELNRESGKFLTNLTSQGNSFEIYEN